MKVYDIRNMNEAYSIRTYKTKKAAHNYLRSIGMKPIGMKFWGESPNDVTESIAYFIEALSIIEEK